VVAFVRRVYPASGSIDPDRRIFIGAVVAVDRPIERIDKLHPFSERLGHIFRGGCAGAGVAIKKPAGLSGIRQIVLETLCELIACPVRLGNPALLAVVPHMVILIGAIITDYGSMWGRRDILFPYSQIREGARERGSLAHLGARHEGDAAL